jgi:hypothetical protein
MQATGTLQRPMQRPWRRRAMRARVAAAAAVRGRTTLTRPVEVSIIHSDIHRARRRFPGEKGHSAVDNNCGAGS